MSVGRIGSIAGAMILIGGALVAGASSASANEVWHQSVGRASADAACPTSSPADLAAGWTQWGASWSQWANNGAGGYTCNREITWAYSPSPEPSPEPTPAPLTAGCVSLGTFLSQPMYINFGGTNYLAGPPGAPSVQTYLDADCSNPRTGFLTLEAWAYAATEADALTLCGTTGVQTSRTYLGTADGDLNAWACVV